MGYGISPVVRRQYRPGVEFQVCSSPGTTQVFRAVSDFCHFMYYILIILSQPVDSIMIFDLASNWSSL